MSEHFSLTKIIQQVIIAVLVAVIISFGLVHVRTNHQLLIFIVLAIFAVAFFVFFLKYTTWHSLERSLMHLFIISAFIGPGLFLIHLGPLSLFPYRVMLPIMILFFLGYVWRRQLPLVWKEIEVKRVFLFYGAWTVYAFISMTWVKSVNPGIKDLSYLVMGILAIAFVVVLFQKQVHYLHFYYVWIFMLFFLIMLGFWNHFTHHQLPLSRFYKGAYLYRARPTAVFTNENDFSTLLAISSFFFISLIFYGRMLFSKLLGLFLLLSSIYLIIAASSRANLLAIFFGMLFWFLFLAKQKQKTKLLLSLVGIVPLVAVLLNKKIIAIVNKLGSELGSLASSSQTYDASNHIRVNLLKNVLVFISNTFGFGVGTGNAETYMKTAAIYDTQGIVNVHNWWAEILLNYGIVIFAGYILLYLYLIIKLYRMNRFIYERRDRMIYESLLCGLIVFGLASISPSSIMALNYNWLFFAFTIGFLNYLKKKDKMA